MNYMELMNRFWLIKDEANFSNNETVLYFALLDLANKFHWEKDELSYPADFLCIKANCSRKVLIAAREKLQEYGLIEVRKGYKNAKAAVIRIMDIPESEKKQNGTKKETSHPSDDQSQSNITQKNGHKEGIKTVPIREQKRKPKPAPYIRQYKDKEEEKTRSSSSSTHFVNSQNVTSVERPTFTEEEEEQFREIVENYNNICHSLHRTYKLSEDRKLAIKGLFDYFPTMDDWRDYFVKLASTPFICGGSSGWTADFDWILEESNVLKIMEGRFYKKAVAGSTIIPEDMMGFCDNDLIDQLCSQGE